MRKQPNVRDVRAAARLSREQWRELVAGWSASGLTQTAFCRQRGVSVAAFYWWRRRFTEDDAKPWSRRQGRRPAVRSGPGAVFREVRMASPAPVPVVPGQAAEGASYEVQVAGGRRIRIGRDFDPHVLGRLIVALEALPGASPC